MRGVSVKRRVIWLTGVGHASTHVWELIFPAVAVPMSRELGIPFEEAVTFGFVLYLLFGLGAPFAGWATDRIGGRRVLIFALLCGGISGFGVWLSSDPWVTRLALGGIGLAASLYHPAGLGLLSVHFEKNIGRAFAINGIAGNVGIAGTPFVAGLLAALVGWRETYLLLCAPGLLFGLLFLFLSFPDTGHQRPDEGPVRDDRTGWMPLLMFAVAVTAGGLAYRLHTLVVPALIQERIPLVSGLQVDVPWLSHVDNVAATALTSAAYAMGIFGQWVGGKMADSRPLETSYLTFHAIGAPLVAIAAVANGFPLLLALFAYLFFAIGMQPIENSLVAKLTPARWRGRAYAGKFVLAFGVGALGTYVVGWVAPFGGLGASLFTAMLLELVLIACVAVIWMIERRRPAIA